MRVVMIGTGYVGLVSGACFAEFGAEVTCVDVDAAKVARLKAGQIPIYEPGLEALVAKNVREKRLTFTTELGNVAGAADLVFVAVGTPSRRGDGHAAFIESLGAFDARGGVTNFGAQRDRARDQRGVHRMA